MTDILERLTTSLADRYRIERELGAGGMATVYLAHDVRHDRKVALKVLRPELSAILGGARFLAEIKTTANLQHPHILGLFDSGEVDGTVFYVMPYVDGESLRDRLHREKQLPIEEAVRIAKGVAEALQYAHQHGIVHRDIKPENVLLQGDHALVADFGIALAASRSDGGSRMTETGMSLGTPHYMAPEQAMGEKEITPKADIYALGCVLYEMLMGEPPFTGPTAQAIIARVMTEQPRSLTIHRHTVPPHIEAVVTKALEKLPADRFATAGQFAQALERPEFAATMGLAATRALRLSSSAGWRGRARHGVPWLVAAGFAMAAAVAWLRPAPPPAATARFEIPIGSIRSANLSPRVSPDGRTIAFAGLDTLGVSRVYLRRLDREDPIPVPGTEGVQNSPLFSPDGQTLLFRMGGKLRRVGISGGAVTVVCDAPGALGGLTWGSRGTIAFAVVDSVFIVPATGGQPRLLLTVDSGSGVSEYRSLAFLPDGEFFLAERVTPRGSDIVVVSSADGSVEPVGLSGRTPHYASGKVVYADGAGAVLAAPFDPGRRRVTGASEQLIERVSMNIGYARIGVSASAITYFTGNAVPASELIEVDRSGRERVLPLRPAAYRSPRYSPDGRRLAVSIVGSGLGFGDIWVYDIASQRLSRVTLDTLSAQPEWTPDGRRLLFARFSGGIFELYQTRADGSTGVTPFLTRRPNPTPEAAILPDGRVVFREDSPGTGGDILVAVVDSPAAARPLAATPFNERGPAVSRDGGWLAFTSNLSGAAAVYLRRLDDSGARWRVSPGNGAEPRWGPGGREIFYRAGDTLFSVDVRLGEEPVFGQPRRLFVGPYQTSGAEALYDVSPDGRRFVMVRDLTNASQRLSLHIIINPFAADVRSVQQ